MSVCDWLYALRNKGSKLGLERMQAFAEALDNPQQSYPTIHVAGSNGKGSVCAMLAGGFQKAGYKVGLFTSPHLVHLGERIQINRESLSIHAIGMYVDLLKPIADRLAAFGSEDYPTFFEFMTLMAFEHFKRGKVDIAIIETGLGGRLDATNILVPEVSVITSIALEHTDILGKSLAAIAREKSGIIKPKTAVVIGHCPAEAELVIRICAKEQMAPLLSVREVFGENLAHYPKTNLEGEYQQINAATALLAFQTLQKQFPIEKDTLESALQEVYWPGRWQHWSLQGHKELILDTAHNVEGASMLRKNLNALGKPIIAIIGILGEERAAAILEAVACYAQTLVLVQPNQPRALTSTVLQSFIPEGFQGNVIHSTVKASFPAKDCCVYGRSGDTLLVTGSIYLVGEVMALLSGAQADTVSLQDKL